MDLDGFLQRTASGDRFCRDDSRAVGKRQPERCSHKTQDRFAIVSMTKKSLHCCIGARAAWHGCMLIFREEHVCTSTGVMSTMHVQVCMLNRYCEHQRTHLRTRSLQGVHMRSCMCSLFIQHWGTRVGGAASL